MAREIADSDDESDIDIAPLLDGADNEQLTSNLHDRPADEGGDEVEGVNAEPAQQLSAAASTDNFEFEQLVRLDSSVDRRRALMQDESLKQSVGDDDGQRPGFDFSTTDALEGSADLGVKRSASFPEKAASRNRAKRRQETKDMIEQMGPPDREHTPHNNKRRKTYGSTSKHQLHDIEYLQDTSAAISRNEGQTVSPEFGQSVRTSKTPDSLSLDFANSNSLGARRNISTSNSSMGGYQSINIDLRGEHGSLDFDANPFGNVSQVSVGDDPDAERIRNFFPAQRDMRGPLPATSEHMGQHVAAEMIGVDPAILMHNRSPSYPNDTQLVSSRSLPKPESVGKAPSTISPPTMKTDASQESLFAEPANAPMSKKKPGRKKSKSERARSPSKHAVEPDMGGSTELAAGSWEEHAHLLTTTTEVEAAKLIDDDTLTTSAKEEAQGPSKRKRSRREEEAEAHVSPLKEPSSELHLSDEVIIGLPPEQYEPRPSRSRSKRIFDEDEDQTVAISTKPEDLIQEATGKSASPSVGKTPIATKQKGKRKTKVKRAKTTIHRAPTPMVDDGDDDVLWMDTKPVSVDIGLLPHISSSRLGDLKQEDLKDGSKQKPSSGRNNIRTNDEDLAIREDDPAHSPSAIDENEDKDTEEDNSTIPTKRRGRPSRISIEFPAIRSSQSPPPAAAPDVDEAHTDTTSVDPPKQPKKRGRKPKKAPVSDEIAEPEEAIVEDEAMEVPGEKQAGVLREKDANVPIHPSSEKVSLKRDRRQQVEDESENEEQDTTAQLPAHSQSPTKPKSPHSPIKDILKLKLSQSSPTAIATSSTTTTMTTTTTTTTRSTLQSGLSKYRIGLSRRTIIPSLLRVVRKESEKSVVVAKKGGRKKKGADSALEAGAELGGNGAENVLGDGDDGGVNENGKGGEDADADGEERPQGLNELLRAEEEYYSP